jgi:hypothetical protein
MAKNKMTPVCHPISSPDFAPCKFFLFQEIKVKLEGKRFGNVSELQQNLQQVLNSIMREECQTCFQ